MADFRKLFLALIAGALLFTAVASAQPFACNANAVPTLGRSEGIAEPTGDVLLVCTGTVPATGILANIRYRLTQNITSDLESGSTTESLLILDEGADGFRGPVDPIIPGQQNIYQAIRISDDEIEWRGVWLAAPGSPAFKVIRLTNIRGNAQAAGDFGTLFAVVNIVSPTSVPVNNPVLRVMDTRPGMLFSVDDEAFKNCVVPDHDIVLNFAEGFASAFKPRVTTDAEGAVIPNSVPGGAYRNESGLNASLIAGSLEGSPGVANQGTRLMARFKDIPAGVELSVPLQVTTAAGLIAQLVDAPNSSGGGGTLTSGTGSADVPSSGLVVYEVTFITALSYSSQETVEVEVSAGFDVPGPLGTGTVNGNFAPISTVFVMNGTAPEPRFVDKGSGQDQTAISISACRSILLFPYVTNQAGFDTGIAIANTTADPLGTAAQAGTCTLELLRQHQRQHRPSSANESFSPARAATWRSWLSGGGGVFARDGGFTACASGACVAPLFQGYIIAMCNFQFAHGFAYVSDVQNDPSGRTLGAMGYLALIIPDRGDENREPQANSLGAAPNDGEGLAN